jgi:hypothetical protein
MIALNRFAMGGSFGLICGKVSNETVMVRPDCVVRLQQSARLGQSAQTDMP